MKNEMFKNKKCFITGAASGIGRATAIAMGERGARLYLTDINAKQLEEVVSMIALSGGSVVSWKALDIRNYDEVRTFTAEIQAESGPMDIVMNIAGTSIWGAVEMLQYEHWKKMIDINLMGPIHVIECLMPGMVKAGRGGHLVNVSSAAGLIGLPWHAAYSASKFGLRGISEVFRYDLRRHGIGVSVVCPGAVKTPLVETALVLGIDRTHPEAKKFMKQFESRAVTPERVALKIIRGMRKNRFLVTTSFDIALIYWMKRKLFIVYHVVMILLNNMMMRVRAAAGSTIK
ncbi:MAG TPA: SDR family oxidoreductase [Spirochaetota bacterium]|nr:SDR family oxidoreductase [Spirochaetota bacterium]HOD13168.1 SDR family oxidoreductase [Spirochaetota bacterium]HPG49025.1 SDR family oxidoreductase [Spirochaetota bacterium]HPN13827.1 SDR family oxidoreductase [Spirochaetota bacterium]HQL82506.1 SDR family oxidoreductase [Spirochaetota bacterium]